MKNKKILVIIIFAIGVLIFLYPIIARIISKQEQQQVISDYIENIRNLEDKELKDETSYVDFINNGTILGYIEIPKIDVYLPIYKSATNEVLAKGIGHLEKTSLPNEGKGTNCVLAGHTGYVKAKLFDDLDKLNINDEFSIYFFNQKLEYVIDDIKTVEPDDTSSITIDENKEYVTLVTCTPQVLNTKRLLVRGFKINNLVD